jgi:serine/threonine protein kinase
VVNIADALDYLHHDCGWPTVHCDLKPNIILKLLDDDMNALLGDFGIARLYLDYQSKWAGSISSIGVKGTIGYIPPGTYSYFSSFFDHLCQYFL